MAAGSSSGFGGMHACGKFAFEVDGQGGVDAVGVGEALRSGDGD